MNVIFEHKSITNSIRAMMNEAQHRTPTSRQVQEAQILSSIENLIKMNARVGEEVTTLAKSEFKMLFMVATFANIEVDEEGKPHIISRRKKGFIFEGNDYYVLDYMNVAKSPTKVYNKNKQIQDFPGADYLIKDLQAVKNQFMMVFRAQGSNSSR